MDFLFDKVRSIDCRVTPNSDIIPGSMGLNVPPLGSVVSNVFVRY